MSRPSSSSSSASSLQHSLAAYTAPVDLPTSHRDAWVTKQLTKYHRSTKPSERSSALLTLSELCFSRAHYADALTFYSALLSLSLSSSSSFPSDSSTLITLLRRIGECHHHLRAFPPAISAFHSALGLLSSLPPSASPTLRLTYEVQLSLGNAYLDHADDDDASLSLCLSRATLSYTHHHHSVQAARTLAGVGKVSKGRAMTAGHASALLRASMNLGNALVQLIHFDNTELAGRRRTASSAATDSSSCSSLSPPSSPTSTSADTVSAPVDATLSSLSTSVLQRHRQLRYVAASSLFDTALTLAVSHGKASDAAMVYENSAAMHEAMGQYGEASDCYEKAAAGRGWEWHVQAMLMWMRAERWDEATREAAEVRRRLRSGAKDEREAALEQVELVESTWRQVQRKLRLQRDIDRLHDDSKAAVDADLRAQLGMLHALVRACVELAESGVGVEGHWAEALAAHHQAIALMTSVDGQVPAELSARVHAFHAYTMTRWLPHLIRCKLTMTEVEEAMADALRSISAARASLSCSPRLPGLLPLLTSFEAQLRLQCGGDLDDVASLLEHAWAELDKDDLYDGSAWVLRGDIVAVMEEVCEAQKDEQSEEKMAGMDWDERREWVRNMGTMARTERESSEDAADKEEAWLTRGLWLLPDDDGNYDSDDSGDGASSVDDDRPPSRRRSAASRARGRASSMDVDE